MNFEENFKKHKKRYIILGILIILCAVGFYYWYTRKDPVISHSSYTQNYVPTTDKIKFSTGTKSIIKKCGNFINSDYGNTTFKSIPNDGGCDENFTVAERKSQCKTPNSWYDSSALCCKPKTIPGSDGYCEVKINSQDCSKVIAK